jgi:hypothetical protein
MSPGSGQAEASSSSDPNTSSNSLSTPLSLPSTKADAIPDQLDSVPNWATPETKIEAIDSQNSSLLPPVPSSLSLDQVNYIETKIPSSRCFNPAVQRLE